MQTHGNRGNIITDYCFLWKISVLDLSSDLLEGVGVTLGWPWQRHISNPKLHISDQYPAPLWNVLWSPWLRNAGIWIMKHRSTLPLSLVDVAVLIMFHLVQSLGNRKIFYKFVILQLVNETKKKTPFPWLTVYAMTKTVVDTPLKKRMPNQLFPIPWMFESWCHGCLIHVASIG